MTTGRIAWWSSEHRASAYQELVAINADLPPAYRSSETNQYELAKDLARRGPFMDHKLRHRYREVTRDLGLELDFVPAADAMVRTVEGLVGWFKLFGPPPASRPSQPSGNA